MKYSKDIIQGLASYIDLKDVKLFIENRNLFFQKENKIFNIGSIVTGFIISPVTNIEYVFYNKIHTR